MPRPRLPAPLRPRLSLFPSILRRASPLSVFLLAFGLAAGSVAGALAASSGGGTYYACLGDGIAQPRHARRLQVTGPA